MQILQRRHLQFALHRLSRLHRPLQKLDQSPPSLALVLSRPDHRQESDDVFSRHRTLVVEEWDDIFRPGHSQGWKEAVGVNEDGCGVDSLSNFVDGLFQGQQFVKLPSAHDGGINPDLDSLHSSINMTLDLGGDLRAEPEPQFGSIIVSVGDGLGVLETKEVPH